MSELRRTRKALGFRLAEVAMKAGMPIRRLLEIERSDDDLEELESESLGDIYGLDPLGLSREDRPAKQLPSLAGLLKSRADELDAESRFSITEAARVALDVRRLQRMNGLDDGWPRILDFKSNPQYPHPSSGQPQRLASLVRSELDLGDEVIRSMKSVLEQLDILVLWVQLPEYIDALSFADAARGACIVANLAGSHMGTSFRRRITWAHELCHLLFDRSQMEKLKSFCAIERAGANPHSRARGEDIERRARAFAAVLLAPDELVQQQWKAANDVRALMDRVGIGFEAARGRLVALELVPESVSFDRTLTLPGAAWESADPGWQPSEAGKAAIEHGVTELRAGALLDAALSALNAKRISESYAREVLRIAPDHWGSYRECLVKLGKISAVAEWPGPEHT